MIPFIIQHANREAVITGSKVHIFRIKERLKKKALRISEWPETDMRDPIKAWNIALLWAKRGFIDDDLVF